MKTTGNKTFTNLFLYIFLLSASVSHAQAPGEVLVKGSASCGSWVNEKSVTVNAAYQLWLMGYLSGFAIGTGKDILKGTDSQSIALWVNNFCKANPLQDMSDAAFQLANELIKLKRL